MPNLVLRSLFRLALAGLSLSALSFGQDHPYFKHHVPNGFIRFGADQPQGVSGPGLPTWQGTSNGVTYTMVGANPATGVSTTLPVVFVPLVFQIGKHTFDPTKPVVGSSLSEIQILENSPVFQPVDLLAGPTDLGANQYIDNFSRANFWTQTGAGSNGYHLMLGQPIQKSPITLKVPLADGTVSKTSQSYLGKVNLLWFQKQINSILATNSIGVNSSQFVIFVSYDIVFTEGQCCIIGFHSQDGNLTYSVSSYVDSGDFSGIEDIEVITHEIGEAMDDPTGVNSVKAWGFVGQVTACQSNLEVGDPVTGTTTAVTLNGFTYHPEDLVFHGWFTREVPSTSVNGWYTLLNSFKGDAKACPPGGTN